MRPLSHWVSPLGPALAIALSLAGCMEESECDTGVQLQSRLSNASPGDVIRVGACTLIGPVTVPPGVRLEGAGTDQTLIVAESGGRAITIDSAGDIVPTAVASLRVEGDGCAGIVATGAGAVAIEHVEIRATRGAGLAVEGASTVTLEDVATLGAIDAMSAETTVPPLPPFNCATSMQIATHGIVLVDVGDALLGNVRTVGFGAFGLLAVRSGVTWNGGESTTNLGAGVELWGGHATLTDVHIGGTRDGVGAIESYGAVFGGGAEVTTQRLVVENGDSFGLFQDSATTVHEDLIARGNGFAAIWAQASTGLELRGGSMLEDNGFAGVVAIASTGVAVRGAMVGRTVERVRVMGVETLRGADGIQMVDSDGAIDGVALRDNERVGLLLDVAGTSTARVMLSNVEVDASGEALGAIAQNGTIPPEWDDAITRLGAAPTNDAAFEGSLPIAGAVGPVCFPPIDRIEMAGIGDLVGE